MQFSAFFIPRFFWNDAMTGHMGGVVLFALLCALGVFARWMVREKKLFRVFAGVFLAGWAVCEIVADIGARVDLGIMVFTLAFRGGQFFFPVCVGFFLCHLVCKLSGRRQLA